jgi:hypothetical protein
VRLQVRARTHRDVDRFDNVLLALRQAARHAHEGPEEDAEQAHRKPALGAQPLADHALLDQDARRRTDQQLRRDGRAHGGALVVHVLTRGAVSAAKPRRSAARRSGAKGAKAAAGRLRAKRARTTATRLRSTRTWCDGRSEGTGAGCACFSGGAVTTTSSTVTAVLAGSLLAGGALSLLSSAMAKLREGCDGRA